MLSVLNLDDATVRQILADHLSQKYLGKVKPVDVQPSGGGGLAVKVFMQLEERSKSIYRGE
jgi:hypothetical protein